MDPREQAREEAAKRSDAAGMALLALLLSHTAQGVSGQRAIRRLAWLYGKLDLERGYYPYDSVSYLPYVWQQAELKAGPPS